mmetsp:Transcript_9550/g.24227  ORF Transcript_9550/g.24227 Transcript_9550/m.24227 type:complete len:902 (+) Transcript_9550:171-2876(+)
MAASVAVLRVALVHLLLLAPFLAATSVDRDRSAINQETTCSALTQTNEVYPVEVGSPVLDLRWIVTPSDKEVDKVVLALTEGQNGHYGGHLYRSEDYGKAGSWEKISSALKGALEQIEQSGISDDEHELGVLEMHFLPERPHRILLQGNDKFHWFTGDYGRTFSKVESPGNVPGSLISFKLHPNNPEYLLALVRSTECATLRNDKCSTDLYVSTDFGKNWQSLIANSKGRVTAFVDFEWGARMHPDPKVANYNEKTVFATVYETGDHAPHGFWDENINFVRSDDFFTTPHETTVKCGNAFEILAEKIFLAVPSDCPYDSAGKYVEPADRGSGRNSVIYVSEDFGLNFAESCVPVKHLGDKSYELRETHDKHGVYVLIDHDEEEDIEAEAPVFNLYSSGFANATLFSLSLERVFSVDYYGTRLADWHRVEGIPGVYIANQLEVGAMTAQTMKQRNWNDFVETLITFNGGGHWQHLQAPSTYRNPKCNLCKGNEKCSLHLHGASSWVGGSQGRPSVYSHWSAPGVLMASGNTGNHLEFNPDLQCTWLSRDGGFTWEDVAHGMFIYEYGDHGGLLLLARHRNQGIPTDTLYYSHDQGKCWNSIKLDEAMYLENIRVEPQGASHIYVLHGEQCEADDRWASQGFNCTFDESSLARPKGLMYVIDFEDIKQWGHCQREDYEQWSPPTPELCLLGHNFTYERRKRDSECFNPKEWIRPIKSTICDCGKEDIECEYGYFRSSYTEPCVKIGQIAEERVCPALEEGYKVSSTHSRFIHGDNCSHPTDVISDWKGNPGRGGPGSHHHSHFWGIMLIAITVVAAVLILLYGWVKIFATDDVRDNVEDYCGTALLCCGSSLSLLGDCLGSIISKIGGSRATPHDHFFRPLAEHDGLGRGHSEPLVLPGQQQA